MKALPWILVVLLAVACMASWLRPDDKQIEIRTETKIRTVVRVDTQLISAPMAVFFRFTSDTIHIGDTVVRREQAYYEDSTYRAWISGYRPKLERLEIFPKTVIQTFTNDICRTTTLRKRWGLGVQAGYGYPGGWYVGAGVSYNLWMW